MEPKLILLDEPTSALDPELVGEVLAIIRELASEGMTMVIVSHELSSIFKIAKRCIVLDKTTKSIIAEGSPDVLKDSDLPFVKAFFNRQPLPPENGDTES